MSGSPFPSSKIPGYISFDNHELLQELVGADTLRGNLRCYNLLRTNGGDQLQSGLDICPNMKVL